MKHFLKNLLAKREVILEVKTRVLYTGMDLQTWRTTPQYLEFARELWARNEWQQALSAIKNSMPSGYPVRGKPITDTEANIELGRKEGYQDCMNVLLSLPILAPVPVAEIEADFDPKDYSKQEEE